eukprot:TRINITY_DN358_c0_g1_i2.p1 TRINITY_DN358_c0_g1~~TRINITY_DN358_c0_g1_i2.p1  ORF type:complete len:168 (-),score=32.18 TRINITY_DN358_c0_g1_i2:227-730(-)
MPDAVSVHRPVVRKITPEQKSFISDSSSSRYGSSNISERSGYLRRTSLNRDSYMEEKVYKWITSILAEKPKKEFERYIQDGSALSRVMTSIVFNSVPLEDIDVSWGTNPAYDRTKILIKEMIKYGVKDIFEPEDLLELRNIPKVTKCLYELSKLASSDRHNLLNTRA